MNNTSGETASDSPRGGGGDEVDKEEYEEEEDKQKQGEVTLPRDTLDEYETSKKIKVSPMMQTVLTMNDIDFIIIVVLDTSKDYLQ
jgi:hypothetical protein